MKWEILYEIPENPFPFEALIAAIFCCILVLDLIQTIKENKENKRKKYKKTFIHWGVLFLLISFICIHIGSNDPTSEAYYNGQYKVYEGNLENYEKVKSTMIDFEIKGETFTWTRIIGLNKVPKEGYVRVYIADEDIARIDKRID